MGQTVRPCPCYRCLTHCDNPLPFNIAIAVTLARLILAPIFAWLLLLQSFVPALGVFLIASISDALDGFLARRFNLATPLGAVLDPLADKLLVGFGILAMSWIGALPLWLAWTVVLRDGVIVSGALAYLYATGNLEMKPLPISKANTAAQFVLVLSALLVHSENLRNGAWLDGLVWIVFGTTLCSGAQYVWEWSRRARKSA